ETLNVPAPVPSVRPVRERGPAPAPPPPPPRRPPDAVPTVIPLPPVSLRGQVGELTGSMALAVVMSFLATIPWAALLNDLHLLAMLFFVTVAVSWAVLVPAKLWTARPGDGWGRHLVLMVVGTLIGAGVLWLNGWTPRWAPPGSSITLGP